MEHTCYPEIFCTTLAVRLAHKRLQEKENRRKFRDLLNVQNEED